MSRGGALVAVAAVEANDGRSALAGLESLEDAGRAQRLLWRAVVIDEGVEGHNSRCLSLTVGSARPPGYRPPQRQCCQRALSQAAEAATLTMVGSLDAGESSAVKLQLALDGPLEDSLAVLRAAREYVDLAEIGTPLVLREGVRAIQRLRAEFPALPLLADFKIMDAGGEEARIAFAAGADIVTVLGVAADETIAAAAATARDCGGELMVDLMAVPQPLQRVQELMALGCDQFCVHRAHDASGDPVASPCACCGRRCRTCAWPWRAASASRRLTRWRPCAGIQ